MQEKIEKIKTRIVTITETISSSHYRYDKEQLE